MPALTAGNTGDCTLPDKTYSYPLLAIVFLVALRLAIGWYFFDSATKKHSDPSFTSTNFLARAQGPFADSFKSGLPDFHGWDNIIDTPRNDASAEPAAEDENKKAEPGAIAKWEENTIEDWERDQQTIANHYGFDDDQNKQADGIFTYHEGRLKNHLHSSRNDIAAFRHELFLIEQRSEHSSAEDVPFVQSRLAKKNAEVAAASTAVKIGSELIEDDFHRELIGLATDKQKEDTSEVAIGDSSSKTFDQFLIYSQFVIGICLLVGLFTRLAALGAGAFLFLVLLTQPPWIVGYSIPLGSGNQLVMMLASFVLVGTAAGRWAGLDYFLHAMLGNCCKGEKGDA
jgi:uncharacterized membrane protein YphA (DoxX/SURF4 family)